MDKLVEAGLLTSTKGWIDDHGEIHNIDDSTYQATTTETPFNPISGQICSKHQVKDSVVLIYHTTDKYVNFVNELNPEDEDNVWQD